MKSIYRYILTAIVITIAGLFFYNKVYIPKTTYKTISPNIGNIDVDVFGVGILGAKEIYNITAGVNAKILSLKKDEGMWVKKGELVAILDSVDLPIQLQEAKISITKAKSEFNASKKELKSLDAQKNLAQITFQRYKKLKEQSFVSQSEYDKAKADLRVIEAQIEATKAHLNSSQKEIERAKKSFEALKEKLSRYKVYAPVDGYIISKKARKGETVLATQPIFNMVEIHEVWIKAYIDERISGDIKVSDKAVITLRSHENQKYKGYVKRIAPQSDALTQEREIDIAFENLPIPFYINEQAEVKITTKQLKDVLKLDAKAIVYKNGQSGVWIKQNSKAHFKKVNILAVNNDEVALSGIDILTTVLIEKEHNKPLKEGMKVH